MPIAKPYRRAFRLFKDGSYSEGGRWQYILHEKYADFPGNYIRAFLLIQKDLLGLFDYIEPSDANSKTHSFRVHELLLRTCVEVEANCKAILRENGYQRSDDKDWSMSDYKKVEQSHYLSQFEVKISNWLGQDSCRKPFFNWSSGGSLPWYQAYNSTKHDRHSNFEKANFRNLIDAVCGLSAIMASQFWHHDFAPSDWGLSIGGPNDGFESSIGRFFRIKYPQNIQEDERYDFDWQQLNQEHDPFQNYNYT